MLKSVLILNGSGWHRSFWFGFKNWVPAMTLIPCDPFFQLSHDPLRLVPPQALSRWPRRKNVFALRCGICFVQPAHWLGILCLDPLKPYDCEHQLLHLLGSLRTPATALVAERLVAPALLDFSSSSTASGLQL